MDYNEGPHVKNYEIFTHWSGCPEISGQFEGKFLKHKILNLNRTFTGFFFFSEQNIQLSPWALYSVVPQGKLIN
jgi:hypothetical protein